MGYATLDDLVLMWRPLNPEEMVRVEKILPAASSMLRSTAKQYGKNLDDMIRDDPDLALVAKSVVVDMISRNLLASTQQEPVSQFTQSAGPYSYTGTYLNPGSGLFIKKTELAKLGLRRQRIGVLDIYGQN